MGCCRARPVPTGLQRLDRRQAVEKSRMPSAQQGEDGGLLQRAVTKRAVAMATSAAIATGVGASSHAPAQQERLEGGGLRWTQFQNQDCDQDSEYCVR